MINQALKKRIFTIIPEHGFLVKNLKKVYRFFLSLRPFLSLVREKSLIFLFEIRNSILSKKPIEVKVGDNLSFKLVPKGEMAICCWAGLKFKKEEIEFIVNQIRPGMTFFDIGSNIGLFSLAAASKCKDVKIYAFEPIKEVFPILKENIQLNGFSSTITPREQVPMNALDAFLKNNNISRVDLMKVDIRGADLLVFQGAKNLLKRPDAPIILYGSFDFYTKRFGYHPVEIMWLLQDFGYSFFLLQERTGRIVSHQPREYNGMMIAIKPGHPAYNTLNYEMGS